MPDGLPSVAITRDETPTYLRVGDRIFLEWHRAQDAFAPIAYMSSGGQQDPRVRVETLERDVMTPPNLAQCCFEVQLHRTRKARKAFEKRLAENLLEVSTWKDELDNQEQEDTSTSEADFPLKTNGSVKTIWSSQRRLGKLRAGNSKASLYDREKSASEVYKELREELSTLEQAMRDEEQANENSYRHSFGHPVLYGQEVELMHRDSGLFISVINARAKDEDKSIRVGVTAGGSSARFLIEPGFKNVKSLGDKIFFDDVIALKSVKHEGMFLRVCESPSQSIERTRDDYVTAAHEVNAGGTRALFGLRFCSKHDMKGVGSDSEIIRGDDIVMLFNPTIEAMLTVSSRQNDAAAVSSTMELDHTKAEHICYFNPTPLKELSSSEFMEDTNSFWKVESVVVKGAKEPIVHTRKMYRLKHVATEAYLCMSRDNGAQAAVGLSTQYADEQSGTQWRFLPFAQGHTEETSMSSSVLKFGTHAFLKATGGCDNMFLAEGSSEQTGDVLRQIHADTQSHDANAARGVPDETPRNLLSIRRVTPDSVVKLRDVRSLRKKVWRFAEDLTTLSTSGSLSESQISNLESRLEEHEVDNIDQGSLKGLQQSLGKLICSCIVGVRHTSNPFTTCGDPDIRYQNLLRQQGLITSVIKILNVLFSDDHLAIPLQALTANTRWGKALLILGKLIFRLLTVVMTDNVANKKLVKLHTDLLIGSLGVRMHVAEALQVMFTDDMYLLHSQAAEELIRALHKIFLSQPYTSRHFNLVATLCFCRGTGIPANQNMLCQMFFPTAFADERYENPVKLVYARKESSPSRNEEYPYVIRLAKDAAEFGSKDGGVIVDTPDFCKSSEGQNVKLYEFFLAQLRAFKNMCTGRNRAVIDALMQVAPRYAITYPDLLDAVRSKLLPMDLRSTCADLVRVLYIDREPCSPFTPVAHSLIWQSRAPSNTRVHIKIVNPWENLDKSLIPEAGFRRFVEFAKFFLSRNRKSVDDKEIEFELSLVKSMKMLVSFGVLGGTIEGDDAQIVKRDDAGYPVIEIKEKLSPIVEVLIKLLDERAHIEAQTDVTHGDIEKSMRMPRLHQGKVLPIGDASDTKRAQSKESAAQAELKCLVCSTLFLIFEMRLHYRLHRAFEVYCAKCVPTLLKVAKVPDVESKVYRPSVSFLNRMSSIAKSKRERRLSSEGLRPQRREKDFLSIITSYEKDNVSGGAVLRDDLEDLAEAFQKAVSLATSQTFEEPIIGDAVKETQELSEIPSFLQILFNMSLNEHPALLQRSFQLIDRHMSQRTAFTHACSASTPLTSSKQIQAHYAIVSCVIELNRLRKWLGSSIEDMKDDAFKKSHTILNQLSHLCQMSADTGTHEPFRVDIDEVTFIVDPPADAFEANEIASVLINSGIVHYLRAILQMPLKSSPRPGLPDACVDWPLHELKNDVFGLIKSLTMNLLPEMHSSALIGTSSHHGSIRSLSHKPKTRDDLRAGRAARQETFYADLITLTRHMGVEKLVAANAISAILHDNIALCKRLPRTFCGNVVSLLANHGHRARWLRLLITAMMPCSGARPLRYQQDSALDSLLLMETAGNHVVDMRGGIEDEDMRVEFMNTDVKARSSDSGSSETLAEWLRNPAQVGNPLDFHLTSVELLTTIAVDNKAAKLRVLGIPGCGFTELVSKACGVLDPVGVHVPTTPYGHASVHDFSGSDSEDVDNLIDSLVDSVSNADMRGMSVLFGKSIYIRLIDQIYLKPNHNEACLAVRDSKSCMWVPSSPNRRPLIDELLDAIEAAGRLPAIDDVHQQVVESEDSTADSESFADTVVTFVITVVVPALQSYFDVHHEFTEYMDLERKGKVVGRIADGLHNLMGVMKRREVLDPRSTGKVDALLKLVLPFMAQDNASSKFSKISTLNHRKMSESLKRKTMQSMKDPKLSSAKVRTESERHQHALVTALKAGKRGYEDEEYRCWIVNLGWRAFAEQLSSSLGIMGGLDAPKALGTKFLAYMLAQCRDVDGDSDSTPKNGSIPDNGRIGLTHAYSVPIAKNSPILYGDVVQRLTAMLRGISSLRKPDVDERLLFRLTRVLTGMLVVTNPHKAKVDDSFEAWENFLKVEKFLQCEEESDKQNADTAAPRTIGGMFSSEQHKNSCSSLAGPKVLSWAQERMDLWGATSAAVHIFSISDEYSARLEGQSLDLLFLLLEKGNQKVSDRVVQVSFQNSKAGTLFLRKISTILKSGIEDAKVYFKTMKRIAEIDNNLEGAAKEDYQLMESQDSVVKRLIRLVRVIKLLRLICEGHHRGAQNMLRSQFGNALSVNIVADLVSAFVSVNEIREKVFRAALTRRDQIVGILIEQLLKTMTEICQGPCSENQDFLVQSSKLLLGVNRICVDTSHKSRNNEVNDIKKLEENKELWRFIREQFDLCNRMKMAALQLLKSLLEGPGAGRRAKELVQFVKVEETIMLQATIAFDSYTLLSKHDSSELSERMLRESFAGIELLHLLRDADSSNFEYFSNVLQASQHGHVLKKFNEEYRSVEIAWMGSVFRTYFRLDETCRSLKENHKRLNEIRDSLKEIPRADPHLKARAFTRKLLVAHEKIKLLDHFERAGTLRRWATDHEQLLVRLPYKYSIFVGLLLILLWRGPPKDPWSSMATSRWHTDSNEAWAKALDTLVSCFSLIQIFFLSVSLWVCVRIEVPLKHSAIAAERDIESFASDARVTAQKNSREQFLWSTFRALKCYLLTSSKGKREKSFSKNDSNPMGNTQQVWHLRAPPPKQREHVFLVNAFSEVQTLIQEQHAHLVLLISYRVAQLGFGLYSFVMPLALFAPLLDYIFLFEGRTVFRAAVTAFPNLLRTMYVIAAVFTLVCVLDYSVFGASDTLYGSFTGHIVRGLHDGDIKDFLQLTGHGTYRIPTILTMRSYSASLFDVSARVCSMIICPASFVCSNNSTTFSKTIL